MLAQICLLPEAMLFITTVYLNPGHVALKCGSALPFPGSVSKSLNSPGFNFLGSKMRTTVAFPIGPL